MPAADADAAELEDTEAAAAAEADEADIVDAMLRWMSLEEDSDVVDAMLPAGWEAFHDDGHDAPYYYHAETDTRQWGMPQAATDFKYVVPTLPAGWDAFYDDVQNTLYYFHAETNTKQWDKPRVGEESSEGEVADFATEAEARAHAREAKADAKRRQKAARWKWTPRPDFPIAKGLIGSLTSEVEETPQHLLDVYSTIFAAADTDGDGTLKCVPTTPRQQQNQLSLKCCCSTHTPTLLRSALPQNN